MIDSSYILPEFGNTLVNIPHSVLEHFGIPHAKPTLKSPLLKNIKNCSKMVLFTIDGFGYSYFKEQATQYSFFNTINSRKLHERITTIFPSTTAAGLTTLHTGLTPKEHGLLKWHLYFREVDAIVQPLPYKAMQSEFHKEPIHLPKDTSLLISSKTLYESLTEKGIQTFYFIPKLLKDNLYTKAMAKGATIVQYVAFTDLLINLKKILTQAEGKVYCYVYWGNIDTEEHVYGPWTEEANAETKLFGEMIQKEFIETLDKDLQKDTALLMTADHGQTAIKPVETLYLNEFHEIVREFMISEKGKPILPSGNPRDIFLHIKPDQIQNIIQKLQNVFLEKADILKLEEVTIEKLFGTGKAHPEFYNRLGNILILPKSPQSIWYQYLPTNKVEYKGHHGGLTADEMYIPFIVARLDQLQ